MYVAHRATEFKLGDDPHIHAGRNADNVCRVHAHLDGAYIKWEVEEAELFAAKLIEAAAIARRTNAENGVTL